MHDHDLDLPALALAIAEHAPRTPEPTELDAARELLRSESPTDRLTGVRALAGYHDPRARRILAHCLGAERDPRVHRSARLAAAADPLFPASILERSRELGHSLRADAPDASGIGWLLATLRARSTDAFRGTIATLERLLETGAERRTGDLRSLWSWTCDLPLRPGHAGSHAGAMDTLRIYWNIDRIESADHVLKHAGRTKPNPWEQGRLRLRWKKRDDTRTVALVGTLELKDPEVAEALRDALMVLRIREADTPRRLLLEGFYRVDGPTEAEPSTLRLRESTELEDVPGSGRDLPDDRIEVEFELYHRSDRPRAPAR